MMSSVSRGWAACIVATLALAHGTAARADQVIITDVTYTHAADTTSDSHYRVVPQPGTPSDWTSPIDYAHGSVHVLLEVRTKPAGDAATKFQICFEGTPAYACTLQSPTYTKPGVVEWTSGFKDLWYGGDVDWSKGTQKIALILKDTMNNKPAGDPKYMPTDLHVEVALVSPGASYVAPTAGSAAAGSGAAGAAGHRDGGAGGVSGTFVSGSGGSVGDAGSTGGGGVRASGGSGGKPDSNDAAGSSGASAVGSGVPAAGAPADSGAPAPAPPAAGATAGADSSGASDAGGQAFAGRAGGGDGAAGVVSEHAGAQPSAGDTAASESSGCSATGSGASNAWTLATVFIAAWLRRRMRHTHG